MLRTAGSELQNRIGYSGSFSRTHCGASTSRISADEFSTGVGTFWGTSAPLWGPWGLISKSSRQCAADPAAHPSCHILYKNHVIPVVAVAVSRSPDRRMDPIDAPKGPGELRLPGAFFLCSPRPSSDRQDRAPVIRTTPAPAPSQDASGSATVASAFNCPPVEA